MDTPSRTANAPESIAIRTPIFRKYLIAFVTLTTGVLVAGGATESYFSYRENTLVLAQLQHEKAISTATTIGQFVANTEREIRSTSPLGRATGPPLRELRENEFRRLLRQAPAITEVSYIDGTGREQVRFSRFTLNRVDSGEDHSADPSFVQARALGTYFSEAYFRDQSEPYMTVAVAEIGEDTGVTVAQVNLKLIWDVISRIKVGQRGFAYVVDSSGNLIAHPDLSLVLQRTDLSSLAQVRAAIASPGPGAPDAEPTLAQDLHGREVLTAHTYIAPPGWWVFVDQPSGDAYAPAYSALQRTAAFVIIALLLSLVASLVLAKRMVKPIQALRAGAAKVGAGALGQRINVSSGDEIEALAQEFNRMAVRLHESYATLEQKVDDRTRALADAMRQLEMKTEELEVAGRHKSEFLAHMSHELRTPLNAIIGFSEVLMQQAVGDLNRKQEYYLRDILDSGRHLLAVINDILDLSKVEAGKMDLDISRFWLPETLGDALAMVREESNRRAIELALNIGQEVGFVDADERKVKQILFNLLSNAVKFTPDGGAISVAASLSDGEIHIAVQDTGVGIAPVDQVHVFEEFYQAKASATSAMPGTGLGLPLARRFVELHGGRIWLASEVDGGTVFTFALPLRARKPALPDPNLLAASVEPAP